jgi:hypothetical protein
MYRQPLEREGWKGFQNRYSAIELHRPDISIDKSKSIFPEENFTSATEAVNGTRRAQGLSRSDQCWNQYNQKSSRKPCFHRAEAKQRRDDLLTTWLREGEGNRRIIIKSLLKNLE